jgi:hypothetical protein
MHPITTGDLSRLLGEQPPPCVSIYLPTHRSYPDSQQGPVHYRNLLDRAEESLGQKYPATQARALLARFRALTDDNAFWTHRLDGLAVLGSPTAFDVFDIPRAVPERVVVADSFHVKPLLRVVQSADRFHVLCLQREEVRLYEGTRDGLAPIRPPGVPLTVTDALGEPVGVERREHAYAGEARPAPRDVNLPGGHAASPNDAKLDAERFFRAVDRAVWEHLSRPSGLPLVVAALPEQQAVFRTISRNPQLVEAGIAMGPAGLVDRQLLTEAWKCVEPRYFARLRQMSEDFGTARARGLASDDLAEAALAAHDRRVGILLVEAERVLPGRIDPETAIVRPGKLDDPDTDDLLDDLAEMVLRIGGAVVVVPRERMPTATGLAAIYRF